MKSKTTRIRTLVASAPFVCAALAALLTAPSAQAQAQPAASANVRTQPANPAPGVSHAGVFAFAPSATTEKSDETATHSDVGSSVTVSGVVMIVNDDGSATLSATFEGGGKPIALKSVHVESDAGELDVASTQMWLPILPGTESRAGDASDAGGFVVPAGLAPGQTVQVQFQFDNDSCLAIAAQAVRRNPTHDEVFPTNGQQLGPGKRTAADPECSNA